MSKVKRCQDIKSGKDAVKLGQDNGWKFRNGKGSHVIGRHSSGATITIPMHKELKPGMKSAIVRVLKATGVALLLVACYLFYLPA